MSRDAAVSCEELDVERILAAQAVHDGVPSQRRLQQLLLDDKLERDRRGAAACARRPLVKSGVNLVHFQLTPLRFGASPRCFRPGLMAALSKALERGKVF